MSRLVAMLACSSFFVAACNLLPVPVTGEGMQPSAPQITVQSVTLVRHPGPMTIARALCGRVAPMPICMALGGAPSAAELTFEFDVTLGVTNTASVPVPLVDALVAFTAFPDQQQGGQHLGAVCVSMCTDAQRCPPRGAAACSGGGPSIRTMNDFAGAAAGFLTRVALGQASMNDLTIQTVPPGGSLSVKVALSLDPHQILDLLLSLEKQALGDLARGSQPQLTIPFSLEGSVWVNIQSFGSVGASFGPVKDTWRL